MVGGEWSWRSPPPSPWPEPRACVSSLSPREQVQWCFLERARTVVGESADPSPLPQDWHSFLETLQNKTPGLPLCGPVLQGMAEMPTVLGSPGGPWLPVAQAAAPRP